MKNNKSGFTLVELLVVITIIGILAGLAVPAVSLAMKSAKKAQASAMISNLSIALTAYETDYGVWPTFMTGNEPVSSYNTALYKMLIGDVSDSETARNNPRGTVYMQFNKRDLTKGEGDPFGGTNTNDADGFMDPWRSPYWVKVDSTYSRQITGLPARAEGGTDTINATIAIWSVGPQVGTPIKTSTGGENRREYITSWR